MSALAFDTHKAVAALKQAGFEEAQAEAVVTTIGEALGGSVATKTDLKELEAALYKQLWLMAVGIVGMTVTLVKLIP